MEDSLSLGVCNVINFTAAQDTKRAKILSLVAFGWSAYNTTRHNSRYNILTHTHFKLNFLSLREMALNGPETHTLLFFFLFTLSEMSYWEKYARENKRVNEQFRWRPLHTGPKEGAKRLFFFFLIFFC